jgi:hypothetical protein
MGRDSSVGIATRYGMDGPGIESRWGQDIPQPSTPALGPTQPPVQLVPGTNLVIMSPLHSLVLNSPLMMMAAPCRNVWEFYNSPWMYFIQCIIGSCNNYKNVQDMNNIKFVFSCTTKPVCTDCCTPPAHSYTNAHPTITFQLIKEGFKAYELQRKDRTVSRLNTENSDAVKCKWEIYIVFFKQTNYSIDHSRLCYWLAGSFRVETLYRAVTANLDISCTPNYVSIALNTNHQQILLTNQHI